MKKGQDGEEFVNNIAYDSFLKYWCYPGPLDIGKDNKEICDLLILFKKTLILVSVKNYSLSDNYKRYFKNTIGKAIKQLKGAERLLNGSRTILLKHPDAEPIVFPKAEIEETFRIIVNLNTGVKIYQTSYYQDGKHFIVMDAEAWSGLVFQLNTLPDFMNYLKARNNLFSVNPAYILPREEYDFNPEAATYTREELLTKKKGLSTILGTELDLLAYYIIGGFKFDENLNFEKFDSLTFKLDGQWDKLQSSDFGKQKEEFEKEGYFVEHLLNEVSKRNSRHEPFARMLYSLSRLERTIFTKHFMKFHTEILNHKEKVKYNRTHYIGLNMNVVFMYYLDDVPQKEIDEVGNASLVHHAYLHDFEPRLIILLGVSKTFENYTFGVYETKEKPVFDEIEEMENTFRKLGWKIKNGT